MIDFYFYLFLWDGGGGSGNVLNRLNKIIL